jgi:prevent-host-death family protein
METVGVRTLKAKLSHYLRKAQQGDEVRVVSRGVVVARIVGVRSPRQGGVDAIRELAAIGLMELPETPRQALPKLIRAPGTPLSEIVSEQRR